MFVVYTEYITQNYHNLFIFAIIIHFMNDLIRTTISIAPSIRKLARQNNVNVSEAAALGVRMLSGELSQKSNEKQQRAIAMLQKKLLFAVDELRKLKQDVAISE